MEIATPPTNQQPPHVCNHTKATNKAHKSGRTKSSKVFTLLGKNKGQYEKNTG